MSAFPEENIPNNVKEELEQYANRVLFYKNRLEHLITLEIHDDETRKTIESAIKRLEKIYTRLAVTDEQASNFTNEYIVSIVSLSQVVLTDTESLIYSLGLK